MSVALLDCSPVCFPVWGSLPKSNKEQNQCLSCLTTKSSNIISKFNDYFSEDFFEVLQIFVGPKIPILADCPYFMTFLFVTPGGQNTQQGSNESLAN